ncbi:hypothetical protein J4G37_35880, partial [Microvirga sp. 3-52]|nr:hypothetical protein [Microvirga sp. 3-52]
EGKIIVDKLKPGHYQFTEVETWFGYDLLENPIGFEIIKGQTEIEIPKFTVGNELITGSVSLLKVDIDNEHAPLSGVVFELASLDGLDLAETTFTTNEEGKIVVNNLKPGKYQFTEVEAPFGYDLLEEPIEFEIIKGQTELEIPLLTVENELSTGSVELIKVDVDDENAPMSGVVFELTSLDGLLLDETTYTTNEDGKIIVDNLKPGKYQFTEVAAPFGYDLLKDPIDFEIIIGQTELEIPALTVGNELTTGSVELLKVDIDNEHAPLSGVVFELTSLDGLDLAETTFTTNEEGKIVVNNLKPGKYQFTEVEAPFGYDLLEEPIEFEIIKGQTELEIPLLTVENELSTGSVKLVKVDVDNENTPMSGV